MDEIEAQAGWLKEVRGEHGAMSGQGFSDRQGEYNVNVGFCYANGSGYGGAGGVCEGKYERVERSLGRWSRGACLLTARAVGT